MTIAGGAAVLYILTLYVLPEKGQDVRQIFLNINRKLSDREGATFIYKVKINGENTVVAAVNVTNRCILEDIVESLHQVVTLKTTCEPVITYQELGKVLGVSDNLTNLSGGTLEKENIFYSEAIIEYYGNSTEELYAVWKDSVEYTMTLTQAGKIFGQTYKHVAQRKLNSFTNGPDPVEYDKSFANLRLNRAFGSNTYNSIKGAQFLEDYVASRNNACGYGYY